MNPDNFVHWTTDLERFEVVELKPGEVGSVALLHYTEKGKRYVMEDRLISVDPGRRYVSSVTGDVIEAEVETPLDHMGDRTGMRLKWSGTGKILPLKLILPLMKKRMINRAKTDLETFKRLVETRGSDFR